MTAAPDRCRKCDAPRPRADQACPRCGLAPEHAEAWAARADAERPPAASRRAWAECRGGLGGPGGPRAGQRRRRSPTGDFGWLAKRYRAVLRERPDDAVAQARLDVLTRRAQAALLATATPKRERSPRKLPLIALIVVIAAIAGTALYAAYLGRRQGEPTGVRRPVEPNRPPPRTLPAPTIEPAPPRR
jgi:hypothetical protein